MAWDPPPGDDLRGFCLYLDEVGKDTFVELELPAATTSYSTHPCAMWRRLLLRWSHMPSAALKYLLSDREYRFQLCAVNEAGEGPMTPILHIWTSQSGRSPRGQGWACGGASSPTSPCRLARMRFLNQQPRQPSKIDGLKVGPGVSVAQLLLRLMNHPGPQAQVIRDLPPAPEVQAVEEPATAPPSHAAAGGKPRAVRLPNYVRFCSHTPPPREVSGA